MKMQTSGGGFRHLCGLLLVAALGVPSGAAAQTTVKYVHTDALGSVVAMTDASGAIVDGRREYEAYGQQLTPALKDGPGYTGHVQDAATGLTYMQQRYYDPQIGLFLSVDSVTAYGNPISQFHRYRYANNNPYKFVDPDGRASDEPARQARDFKSMTSRLGLGASKIQTMQVNPSRSSGRSPSSDSSSNIGSSSNQQTASAVRSMADANGMIAGAKQNSLVSGAAWRGANGKMYDIGWGGNQHTGARSLVLQEANAFRVAGQGLFLLSSGISIYEGLGALQSGDGFGVVKSGVDIGWGAAATFGGPVGLVGGASYTGASFLVTIPAVHQYTVEPTTDAMCWASGNC